MLSQTQGHQENCPIPTIRDHQYLPNSLVGWVERFKRCDRTYKTVFDVSNTQRPPIYQRNPTLYREPLECCVGFHAPFLFTMLIPDKCVHSFEVKHLVRVVQPNLRDYKLEFINLVVNVNALVD